MPEKSIRDFSDDDLAEAYQRYSSVNRAAEELGLNAQSLHRRLQIAGVDMQGNGARWTDIDTERVRELYSRGFQRGDGKLDALAKELGRTKAYVARKARSIGMTNQCRSLSTDACAEISRRMKESYESNPQAIQARLQNGAKNKPHPRGALGLKHSDKTKQAISKKSKQSWEKKTPDEKAEKTLKMMRTRERNGTMTPPRQKVSWKQGWRTVGGQRCYFRSRWEANYARYLEWLRSIGEIKSWEHEPETFWFEGVKRGCVSYLPDFRVTQPDGIVEFHEVKGWMDARSKTKLRRMKKYHPDVTLVLIDANGYKALARDVKRLISGWE